MEPLSASRLKPSRSRKRLHLSNLLHPLHRDVRALGNRVERGNRGHPCGRACGHVRLFLQLLGAVGVHRDVRLTFLTIGRAAAQSQVESHVPYSFAALSRSVFKRVVTFSRVLGSFFTSWVTISNGFTYCLYLSFMRSTRC